jgi:hypothetical protein
LGRLLLPSPLLPPHFTLLSFFPFALSFARAKAKGRKKVKRGGKGGDEAALLSFQYIYYIFIYKY